MRLGLGPLGVQHVGASTVLSTEAIACLAFLAGYYFSIWVEKRMQRQQAELLAFVEEIKKRGMDRALRLMEKHTKIESYAACIYCHKVAEASCPHYAQMCLACLLPHIGQGCKRWILWYKAKGKNPSKPHRV